MEGSNGSESQPTDTSPKRPEGGPSSLGKRKGSDISRRCAGIVVAEQNGSQSAFDATAVLLARPERKVISVSPGARNR